MTPLFAVGTWLISLLLLTTALMYLLIFVLVTMFLLAGLIGLKGWGQSRIIDLCATILLTNAGQVVGWFRFLTGRPYTMWTPQR